MCRLVILVLLLLQVLSAFGSKCFVKRFPQVLGKCVKREDCWTETIYECPKGNGFHCCPPIDYRQPIDNCITTDNKPRTENPPTIDIQLPNMRSMILDCGETPAYPFDNIVGGKRIPPEEYSWIASLEYRNLRDSLGICSGSVISSLYVITAAHCIDPTRGPVTAVRLGDFESTAGMECDYGGSVCEPYQRIEVAEIFQHPEYPKNKTRRLAPVNDAALLKLKREIVFSAKLKPICLPHPELGGTESLKETLIASGWGKTEKFGCKAEKRAASLQVLDESECEYSNKDKHICAGGGGNNTCDGDSGGPLMRLYGRRMVLEGITSQGYMDCTKFPSIGIRVRDILEWIKLYVE